MSNARGGVAQYRRLAGALRNLKQEVKAQGVLISRLQEQLEQAEAQATDGTVKRGAPAIQKTEELEKELEARFAAAEQRAKRREETTRRRLKQELTEQKADELTDEAVRTRLAEVERRLKKREQTTRRKFADTAEQLEGKLMAELSDTVDQLERTEAALKAEIEQTTGKKPTRAKPRRAAPKKSTLPKGQLDVNELSFEQFRELGLSLTQSSRMVALRDRHGEITDIDQLDEVVGLPAELRSTLKSRLTVR